MVVVAAATEAPAVAGEAAVAVVAAGVTEAAEAVAAAVIVVVAAETVGIAAIAGSSFNLFVLSSLNTS